MHDRQADQQAILSEWHLLELVVSSLTFLFGCFKGRNHNL